MAKLEQGILGPFRGKVGTVVGYLWRGRHVVRAYRREVNYPNTDRQQAERAWFVEMVRFAATARQALLLGLRERASAWQMTEGNAFVKMNKDCFGRTHAPVAACGGATPSNLEGEMKCRDAACRVRNASADNPIRKASAVSPERRVVADAARCVPTKYERDSVADAARCVPTEYERIRISEGAAAPVFFREANISDDGILRVDFEKNSGMSRAKGSDRVYVYVYNSDTREGLLSHPAERRHGKLQMQLPDGWTEQNTKLWGFVVDKEGHASMSTYIKISDATVSTDCTNDNQPEEIHPTPCNEAPKVENASSNPLTATFRGRCRDGLPIS
jgi:hypothetical protein